MPPNVAAEKCPECAAPLERMLCDDHGGQFWRCVRTGFHWVEFNGDWYRESEWSRKIAYEGGIARRAAGGKTGKPTAKEMRKNPLRRPDWRRAGKS